MKKHISQHTPTIIEETWFFGDLCGKEFLKELDMVHHLNKHIIYEGLLTPWTFFCRLCRDALTEKDTINKHRICHIENVLKKIWMQRPSINYLGEKLATTSESKHESESEEEFEKEWKEIWKTSWKSLMKMVTGFLKITTTMVLSGLFFHLPSFGRV